MGKTREGLPGNGPRHPARGGTERNWFETRSSRPRGPAGRRGEPSRTAPRGLWPREWTRNCLSFLYHHVSPGQWAQGAGGRLPYIKSTPQRQDTLRPGCWNVQSMRGWSESHELGTVPTLQMMTSGPRRLRNLCQDPPADQTPKTAYGILH